MITRSIDFIVYLAFRLLVGFFAIIPFRIIYVISDGLRFLLQYVIRYRFKVISSNLERVFPEYTRKEISKLRSEFYKALTDCFLEGLKGFTLSEGSLKKRYFMHPCPEMDELYRKGQSVLFAGSHYNNWEWGVLIFNKIVRHQICGIYQVVSNTFIHEYLMKRRARFGMKLISAQGAVATITGMEGVNAVMTLSDQSPVNMDYAIWLDFLGTNTPFLHGLEAMAKKTGYPVIYYEVMQARRGFYEINAKLLVPHPKETEAGEITRLYGAALEATIRKNPARWLWSHRRWKRVDG
jgi:KDO2-lipid IV(A) lauroyltransferase